MNHVTRNCVRQLAAATTLLGLADASAVALTMNIKVPGIGDIALST